ncbi:centrosomal protein of 19 kDa [Esox lucius]|uniref:Centrosomal protein of 19 kDa n=1 Tax=Esox lucius TaxID=8010 RepID=A0AAY5L2K6_ESOLU|nr:centrosomal protein of 19 kDa [Esox lucius]
MQFVAKRCGVKFSPPSVVLIYESKDTKTIRKRIIPVRNFSKCSDCCTAANRMKYHVRHREYLEGVTLAQLERLHIVLQDHMQGRSLEHTLASLRLDPEEDLNKLDDEDLARKKAQMDELFECNRRQKDDPGFVYDLEVEFKAEGREPCSWDEETSDDGF